MNGPPAAFPRSPSGREARDPALEPCEEGPASHSPPRNINRLVKLYDKTLVHVHTFKADSGELIEKYYVRRANVLKCLNCRLHSSFCCTFCYYSEEKI